nr:zinc finger, CCHC-type, retrotransposon Gag domain protein [Tanacetum cinerariifolium]
RFNKQKPHSFEKATAPVDAENWISHIEKIFDVMGCEDAFKTRLAVYKFEGNALAWWKAYKQAKVGDAWLITYHSIRQTSTETSTDAARNYEILHERDDEETERPDKRRVVIGISRPLNRVVTGTTVIITTVMGQTGEVVVTTIAATTTTLETTS